MTSAPQSRALPGPVLVVGCGLVGTSLALALTRSGAEVHLRDTRPEHARTAEMLGAGTLAAPERVALVVVAVPPDYVAEVVAEALGEWPDAVVTDVASVKLPPLQALASAGTDGLERYVGSHPMAGSERSGPTAASENLFEGRAWAITPHAAVSDAAMELVRDLGRTAGATLVEMPPDEHDVAVARVSHLPQVMSVLTAARLHGGPTDHLALAGQGLRDVTRIAGSDPGLWRQILYANRLPLVELLRGVRDDLDELLDGIERRQTIEDVLGRGVSGTRLIPGKHGEETPAALATVFIQVPDQPGELGRLFRDTGQSGVNIEDLRIDHDLGRPVGVAEITVRSERADELAAALTERGWTAHL
ncbi:prephenate dehydrogenase [Mumia sp. zg.B53]|uniref:prephenate dehydrogenase n=1 Tax=unclassified Mumia TaxID=2621872 RepID=UPI001C6F5767|nr:MULTISPECIES: prephenate dehydrogenase [unclassified Mumia]MBW9204947.1 prephenate dehydrogenase [Mumia sp. zg.B17]MBW9209049.1 prephenate dehydrogenase [Mumia sp. zg.B21]MBW9213660.1 prephenate dehydrogenase [Mumia sp. zg.B53]